MVEINNALTEMKNAFNGLINRETVEGKKITELQEMSI